MGFGILSLLIAESTYCEGFCEKESKASPIWTRDPPLPKAKAENNTNPEKSRSKRYSQIQHINMCYGNE